MNRARAPLLLLVDDDDDIREMLATILEADGFRIATAANGEEALERMDEERPDLLILDMRMPVMDGWELSRILEERGDRPPLVVVTAAADPAARAADIAADAWLAKPFDISDLEEVIGSLLEPS